MAKRKSRRPKPPKKPPPKVDVSFQCPFCNHPDAVVCSLDFKLKIGEAVCWTCKESYATKINFLSEPIDIYSEWIDACEAVNAPEAEDDDDRPPRKRIAK